jgi:HEAT repeat protein
VSNGLKTTLRLLSETENEASVRLLIPALDLPYPEVAEGALRAILDRRSLAGQHEVLSRLHTLSERWKQIISDQRGGLSQALRDAVLNTDPQVSANGCQAILWFQEYDLVPALINALEDEANVNAELAARTLLALMETLYEELAAPRDYRNRRDPQRDRQHATSSLESSVLRYPKHQRKEVVEAFLIVAPCDNVVLTQVLSDPHHGTYLAMVDALLHSPRPGVMRLLLNYLDHPHPPSAALAALARRGDRKFVGRLLKRMASEPTSMAAQNLKRIELVPWTRPEEGLLTELDDADQPSVVRLVMASGMKRGEAFKTIEWLLRKGAPAGRRAAASALAEFNGAEANQAGLAALDDPDPLVQAAAVRQLRQRGIPGVLARLIDLVDSPHGAVREAASDSLTEFRFPRFLGAFDLLEDDARRSTGALVKKIDPSAIPLLREELRSAVRSRRLRGIQVTVALDAMMDVESDLMRLAGDDDHLVRLESIRALSLSTSPSARESLAFALADSSLLIREAAERALCEVSIQDGRPGHPSIVEQVATPKEGGRG